MLEPRIPLVASDQEARLPGPAPVNVERADVRAHGFGCRRVVRVVRHLRGARGTVANETVRVRRRAGAAGTHALVVFDDRVLPLIQPRRAGRIARVRGVPLDGAVGVPCRRIGAQAIPERLRLAGAGRADAAGHALLRDGGQVRQGHRVRRVRLGVRDLEDGAAQQRRRERFLNTLELVRGDAHPPVAGTRVGEDRHAGRAVHRFGRQSRRRGQQDGAGAGNERSSSHGRNLQSLSEGRHPIILRSKQTSRNVLRNRSRDFLGETR